MNPVKESFISTISKNSNWPGFEKLSSHKRGLDGTTPYDPFWWEKVHTWLDTFEGYELVKKEPEIARCVCRAGAAIMQEVDLFRVVCSSSHCFEGPGCFTSFEAIQRWNEVMI